MFNIFKRQRKKPNTDQVSFKDSSPLSPSPSIYDDKGSTNSKLMISKASTFGPTFLSSFYQIPQEKAPLGQTKKIKTQVSKEAAEIQRLNSALIEKEKIIESLLKTNVGLSKQNTKYVMEIASLKRELIALKESQMTNSIMY